MQVSISTNNSIKNYPLFFTLQLTNTISFYLQDHLLATVGVPSGIFLVRPAFCDPAGLNRPLNLQSFRHFLLQQQAVSLERVDAYV